MGARTTRWLDTVLKCPNETGVSLSVLTERENRSKWSFICRDCPAAYRRRELDALIVDTTRFQQVVAVLRWISAQVRGMLKGFIDRCSVMRGAPARL